MPAKRKSWYVAVKVRCDAPVTEAEARQMLIWDTALTYEEHYADSRRGHGVAVFKTPTVTSLRRGQQFNDQQLRRAK